MQDEAEDPDKALQDELCDEEEERKEKSKGRGRGRGRGKRETKGRGRGGRKKKTEIADHDETGMSKADEVGKSDEHVGSPPQTEPHEDTVLEKPDSGNLMEEDDLSHAANPTKFKRKKSQLALQNSKLKRLRVMAGSPSSSSKKPKKGPASPAAMAESQPEVPEVPEEPEEPEEPGAMSSGMDGEQNKPRKRRKRKVKSAKATAEKTCDVAAVDPEKDEMEDEKKTKIRWQLPSQPVQLKQQGHWKANPVIRQR